MKKILSVIVLAAMLILPVSLWAASYESITVADTAIGITSALLTPTLSIHPNTGICTLETAQVRFRLDGTDPTSSTGHLLNIGYILYITSKEDLMRFRAIRTGSTSGVLNCTVTYRKANAN